MAAPLQIPQTARAGSRAAPRATTTGLTPGREVTGSPAVRPLPALSSLIPLRRVYRPRPTCAMAGSSATVRAIRDGGRWGPYQHDPREPYSIVCLGGLRPRTSARSCAMVA
jgi:hypothetical protein